MDKNSYIGLVLIFATLIGFYFINQPSDEERQKWQEYHAELARIQSEQADSLRRLEEQNAASQAIVTDLSDSAQVVKYGLLAKASQGEEEFYTLENEQLRVVISSKGGRIYSAELKDYKKYGDLPLCLFDGDKNEFGFHFAHNNRFFYTNDLFFESEGVVVDGDSTSAIDMIIPVGNGKLKYRYELPKSGYAVDFAISGDSLIDKIAITGAAVDLSWIVDMPTLEKSYKSESMWSSVYYRYPDGDVEELGTTGNQQEEVNMSVSWVAAKDQYFSSVFYAKQNFVGAQLASTSYEQKDSLIKHVDTKLGVKLDLQSGRAEEFQFLFIPNYFYVLDSFEDMELTELLPLGWGIFGWINEYFIIPLFKLLETVFSNYGIIILILTVIIKLIIFPFSLSSFKSQAKMRVLKPQIDEINKKIPAERAMERQQETMKLYKRAGISPMGGCLPLLLQMPILFAAFRFFPAAVELRGESFLWADDLSTYDSILELPFSIPFYGDHVSLFCLLMCIVNVVYTRYNMQSQSSAQMPGMSVMMYLMPVMLLFFFNDYPAGLCYYYFISTLITVLQTTIIKNFFIDEKAILEKIEANKRRPQNAKKSKWQARYEELMKEQMRRQQKR